MKTNLLILLAIFTGTSLMAQEEPDTTRFKFGGMEVIIVGNDTTVVNTDEEGNEEPAVRYGGDMTYWSGFEVGVNLPMNGDFENAFNSPHLQTDPSQSFVYNFNIAEKRIKIYKDYVGIVTGLGFTNSRYGFKDNTLRLAANTDSTFGISDTTLFNGFSKNQLRVNTFRIPLLFHFNTGKNDDNNFHLSAGAIGGLRIGSNVKYKYDLAGGGDTKNKEKGRYNLNPFQLMGTVRVGYNDFGLFANYNLLSLYETGKSEVAYPFSFGASFHF